MALPTLPSLPTDNLYKFLAIFGLILFVLSIYLVFEKANETIENADKKLEDSLNDLFTLRSNHNLSEAQIQLDKLKESDPLANQWERQLENIREENYNAKEKIQGIINYLLYIMLISGIVMMSTGFYYWYYRVQKPLDELTKMELAKMKIDLIKSNPTETKEENK